MSRVEGRVLGAVLLLGATFFTTPSNARETCWTMGGGQFFNAMHYCVSSFLPRSRKWRYGPENLSSMEGGRHLAWCEGARGDGIGQTVTIRVNNGSSFSRLQIANGYGKTRKSYFENGRIKDLRITTNTGINTTTRLPDQNGVLPLYLPNSAEHKWVKLEILSVYRGSRYRDTCLDFVMPDFEYDEQLLQSGASQPKPSPPVPAPVVEEPLDKPPNEAPPLAQDVKPQPTQPPSDIKPPRDDDDPFGELGMPDPEELELPDQ